MVKWSGVASMKMWHLTGNFRTGNVQAMCISRGRIFQEEGMSSSKVLVEMSLENEQEDHCGLSGVNKGKNL